MRQRKIKKKGHNPEGSVPFLCFNNHLRARFLRQVGGAEEECGGVARHVAQAMTKVTPSWRKRLVRTYRINSKCLSSHVSSVMSMNLLQMVDSMLITP